ncbi:ferritin [Sulfurimonas sp. RIFOXYD2_FULL_34_21]|uniref:ferritin n=1 Tax=Sulfurimonas sp. RIFOXYD2_FULL_34_21 TaxID=1802261 RepID=UPI0025CF2EB6|nr:MULTISPECIES: ferritin [unclassified Sulfurimonas]
MDAIAKPDGGFKDLKDVFEKTYNHELLVSKSILDLVDISLSEKDYATFNFLQWYVSEQHEEEKLFKDILDKFEIIGMEGRGLYMIDREIEALLRQK